MTSKVVKGQTQRWRFGFHLNFLIEEASGEAVVDVVEYVDADNADHVAAADYWAAPVPFAVEIELVH